MGAAKILSAGMMWDIRSKLASTVGLHAQDGTSDIAGVIRGRGCAYHLTTAPYPAYKRWRSDVASSPFVRRDIKASYPHHVAGATSDAFSGKLEPIFGVTVGADARLHRYSQAPRLLAIDMEQTLREIRADVAAVIEYYDTEIDEVAEMDSTRTQEMEAIVPLSLNLDSFKPAVGTYWDLIAQMEPLVAQDIVDTVVRMDTAVSEEIEAGAYENADALVRAVWEAEAEYSRQPNRTKDAVV
jgi:hypothetical protein